MGSGGADGGKQTKLPRLLNSFISLINLKKVGVINFLIHEGIQLREVEQFTQKPS